MQSFTDVYYAQLPAVMGRRGIYPPQREAYVLQTHNPLLQRQRYYVWLLLEYAVNASLKKGLHQLSITQDARGKWLSPFIHFSLAHEGNAVAVAISDKPVGVDIQKRIENESAKTYILTPDEYPAYERAENKTDFLTELWTKKESLFKIGNQCRFNPKTYSAQNADADTRWLDIQGERYALSATSRITRLEEVRL